jgi:heat shock protein HslJ
MRAMPGRPSVVSIPIVVALAFAVVVAACDATESSPSETPEPTPAADLGGTSWILRGIAGVEPAGESTLTFEDGGVGGSTGCNSFRGDYAVDGSSLVFSPLAATKRACADPALTDQETAVLEALAGVTSWEIGGDGRLTLGGSVELVYDPATR